MKLVNKQEQSTPTLKNDNANVVSDEEKAHLLNTFSLSVGSMLNLLYLMYTYQMSVQDDSCLDNFLCTTDETIELIRNVDITKANV